ncbi:MAG: DNA polymerase III subunit delta [Clostridia bacterium]|nr:DNA polymerase III subunit delta [Clostridia bacterium]
MTRDQLFKAVAAGQIARAYAFYGRETLILDSAIKAIEDRILPEGLEDLNRVVFEGEVPASQIIEAGETFPLMADRRLVLIKNSPFLTSPSKNQKKRQGDATVDAPDGAPSEEDDGGSRDSASDDARRLAQWLGRIPETVCLIFVSENKPSGQKVCGKALEKVAEYVEFGELSAIELLRWCQKEVRLLNCSMGIDAVAQLTSIAGKDLRVLRNEIQKLCAYVDGREITVEDVESIVTPSAEYTVFKMIDALMLGRPAQAETLLKGMLLRGESPYAVIAMLERQLRILTSVRLLRSEGISLQEMERRFEWRQNVLRVAAQQAARFSVESLRQGYQACVDADFALKSGRIRPEIALDRLMLALADMKTV